MAQEGNTKKERIEKLEEKFTSLSISIINMETENGRIQEDLSVVKDRVDRQRARIEDLEHKPVWFGMLIFAAIASIIVSVVSIFMVNTANKEIDALQEEVQALQSTNVVSVVSTQPNATEEFINAIFPMEDSILYDKNGNTFYRDPDCKYAITNPEFCSYRCKSGEDSLGNNIDVYRLTDGNFAYIPSNFSVDLWWHK